ncbi:MAG: RagB/SusD family nutrient uptake outer membrane protein [Tannerella sp.]|nr:RagB/SusD family nutrient uptake outer membrane protein [Tannerella sp.]
MKRKIFSILLTGAMCAGLFSSCNDILEEQPRAVLTPDLFRTTSGLQSGLTAAYQGLRPVVGGQGPIFCMEAGTDEFTAAESFTNWPLDMTPEMAGTTPITSQTGDFSNFWNSSYQYINTCNGIVEYGEEAGLSSALIAEARFLRAYFYFNLVQMFGGCPLDLGSGELKFNTTPNRMSTRNSVAEVYAAILADMNYSVENLPVESRLVGTATKKAALHYLAKVHLTMGNHQQALSTAETLLHNQATYGVALQPTYADVVREGNEHNSEVLFTCERTNDSYTFNGFPGATDAAYTTGIGEERAISYYTPNYPTFVVGSGSPVGRSVAYSRPWIRLAPTDELINGMFADKTNDSRYFATFQTVWLSNVERGGGAAATYTGLLDEPINVGDTAFVFTGYEVSDEYRASKNYRIWTPSQHTRGYYPSLHKFFDTKRKNVNDASGRTWLTAKLSETYLIAAEAAVQLGDNAKAREYILTLRRRAAFPGHEDAMVAATPATITIDYVLDERSRELCGEQHRWLDLIRTGKWVERSSVYHLGGREYVRDIKPHYVLRPIPQSDQMDRMHEDVDHAAYQNPGY